MKKIVVLFGLAALLCGCESEAEQKDKWVKFCTDGEFSPKQCEVLYSMKKSSDDAESSASAASVTSGIAMGMSAGAAGRR